MAITLVAAVVATTWQAVRARQAEVRAVEKAAMAQRVNDFLNRDVLGAMDPRQTPDYELTKRELLDIATKNLEGKFEDEPLVEASIRATLGETYES